MRAWWIAVAAACGGGAATHVDGQLADSPADVPVDAGLVQTTGSADPAFGSAGVLVLDFGGIDTPEQLVARSAGFLVGVATTPVGSNASTSRLVAFGSDGTFDQSFGSDGVLALGESMGLLGALSDGRLVLADGGGTFERRLGDGSLDASYGFQGQAQAYFELASGPIAIQGTYPNPVAVNAAGEAFIGAFQSDNHTLVSRLTAAGKRDQTFGISNGTVQAGFGNPVSFATEPDGTLMMAVTQNGHALEFRHLRANGDVDPAFSATLDGVESRVCGMLIDASGRMTVAGTWQSDPHIYVARFTPNGSPDGSFHGGGMVDLGAGQCAAGVIGGRAAGGELLALRTVGTDTAVMAVDASADHTTTYPTTAFIWLSLLEAADGKILAAGRSTVTQTTTDDVWIERFLP